MKLQPCMAAAATLFFLNGLAEAQSGVIEEVVVTAAKREGTLQDTPLSITAYGSDYLQNLQIEEIEDISVQTPSMAFSRAGGEAQLYIRGVGTNLFGIGQDGSVAVHQDGVYLGRAQMGLSQFLDVERVEVLRGPQGTLYGRNATAGVINVISRGPTEETEGYVSGYLGNFDSVEVEGAVGGPISDHVGYRVAVRYADNSGFTDDLDPAGGDEIDNAEALGIRGTLEFSNDDNLTVRVIADYTDFQSNNRTIRPRDNIGRAEALGALPLGSFHETRNNMPTFHNTETGGVNVTVDWDINDQITLSSVTGIRMFEDDFSFNTDGTEIFVTETQFKRDTDQVTQELRLANEDGGFDWLVGLFYMTEDKEEALGLPAVNFGGSFNIFADNEADAWALFAEGSWELNDRLTVTVGGRLSDEEKDDTNRRGLNFNFEGLRDPNAMNFDFPFGSGRVTSDSWDAFTPKVGVEYQADDNTLLYFNATRGFKSGGTNSLDNSPAFDPEFIWAYEGGFKINSDDDRLRLNGALFYYDYSDLQVSTFLNGTTVVENAAEATILGLEFDLLAAISDRATWSLGLSLLNAQYDEFISPFAGAPVDLTGNTLINAPEFKATTSLTYDIPLSGGGTLRLFGQASHQSEVFHSQFNEEPISQDAFTLANARIAYLPGDGNWEIAAVIKNAFDQDYFQNSVRFTSTNNRGPQGNIDTVGAGSALGYPGEGRSYGVQAKYRF